MQDSINLPARDASPALKTDFHKSDLMARLRAMDSSMSRGQKSIAAYIMAHYDKAAFMTANRLGIATGVSESTVVRFAIRLGYEGYPEMQAGLQDMIRFLFQAAFRKCSYHQHEQSKRAVRTTDAGVAGGYCVQYFVSALFPRDNPGVQPCKIPRRKAHRLNR